MVRIDNIQRAHEFAMSESHTHVFRATTVYSHVSDSAHSPEYTPDETRRRVVQRADVANRLLDLITSGPTQDCRKNAARTMENVFMLAEVRAEAVQRGYHVRLQRLLDAPTTPKIVQKFIASALVQLLEEGARAPCDVLALLFMFFPHVAA